MKNSTNHNVLFRNSITTRGRVANHRKDEILWIDVDSSAITALGYCYDNQTLYIEFVSGSIAEFEDASLEEFYEFLSARSIGKHYNQFYR